MISSYKSSSTSTAVGAKKDYISVAQQTHYTALQPSPSSVPEGSKWITSLKQKKKPIIIVRALELY